MMRALLALAGALVLGGSIAAVRARTDSLPFYQGRDHAPEWISRVDPRYRLIHQVPEFTLLDQDGREVSASALDGRVSVVSFFFTSCKDLCPRLHTNLTAVQDAFHADSDVAMFSVTVDPQADDTAALRRYAAVNHLQPGMWRLLTGPVATIHSLMASGFLVALPAAIDGQPTTAIHSETVVLVDARRRIRGMYDGSLRFDVDRLIEDVRRLR